MANTESFVFYRSFYESIEHLDDETQLQVFKAICEYALNHNDKEIENVVAKSIFTLIKPQLDASFQRRITNIENGKKGGRPSKTQSSEELEDKVESMAEKNRNKTETKPIGYDNEKPKQNLNVNVNANVNANANVNNKHSRVFIKPTVDEVREYCESRNNEVDPEEFVDFYTSKNWMVGKNKMVDWKASVRTWERNKHQSITNQYQDIQPVYDASKNKKLSDSELNELLALRNN